MTAKKLVVQKRCLVCNSPDRVMIESARVAGISLDVLAAKYGIERTAIHRHEKNHLTDDARAEYLAAIPMAELAEKSAEAGISVLQHFNIVRATLMRQFQLAASLNDRNGTATLAGRLTEVLRAIGTISGEMSSMAVGHLTVNNNTLIMNSPAFANLQANLLTALQPFPEARNAVVAALRQMDEPEMKVIENAVPKTIEHVAAA